MLHYKTVAKQLSLNRLKKKKEKRIKLFGRLDQAMPKEKLQQDGHERFGGSKGSTGSPNMM